MQVVLFIVGVLVMLVGLVVSIGLHELGHLIPAKRFGVRVGQYMIGFGPTLWSKRIRGTEYGVKLLPFGGYISMAGMYPPRKGERVGRDASTGFLDIVMQDADAPTRAERTGRVTLADEARESALEGLDPDHGGAFYKVTPWKRVIIMLGGPFMNLVLAVLFMTIVLCGFGLPQNTLTIGSVSQCVLPAGSTQTDCTGADEAPAAAAGLKPGDTITSIDGQAVTTWTEATTIIRNHPGDALPITVTRDGAEVALELTPVLNKNYALDADGNVILDADKQPTLVDVGYAGIGSVQQSVPQPITAVPGAIGDQIVGMVQTIAVLPQKVYELVHSTVTGEERDKNGLVGIVGIGRLAGEISSFDAPVASRVAQMLSLLGGLNVALFVFNLVPLLPLDGGHVLGAIWESIRRRVAALRNRPDPGPFDLAKFLPVTLGITAILGGLSLLLVVIDLINPISFF